MAQTLYAATSANKSVSNAKKSANEKKLSSTASKKTTICTCSLRTSKT